jgi:enamine deaminase RidA (YjgF/YER057c/UK114 family)
VSKTLQPPQWPRPKGYSNGISASGRQVFVAGQIAWNEGGEIVSDVLALQVRQALANILEVLAEDGARAEHIVRLTWYVTRRDEYLAQLREIGEAYKALMGRHYPAMSVVQVVALVEARAKVEIEATAVVPEGGVDSRPHRSS